MARVTIDQVASEVGVSRQTVSRALNDMPGISATTKHRVLEVARRMNYRPSRLARGLAGHHSKTMGIMFGDIENPYFAQIARGAEAAAREHGYHVIITSSDTRSDKAAENLYSLAAQGVDGVILYAAWMTPEAISSFAAANPELIVVNARRAPDDVHKFLHDEQAAALKVAQHLEKVGRSTVAIISPPDWSGIPHPRTEAHREHLAPVVEVNTERTTGGGRDATRELIASRRSIDTVVAYNDIVALGCLRGLHDLGVRSPDDIAVVGYDNTPFAEISVPSLTSIGFRADELGRQLVRQLLEIIADPTSGPSTTLVEPELFVRESTTFSTPAKPHLQEPPASDNNG